MLKNLFLAQLESGQHEMNIQCLGIVQWIVMFSQGIEYQAKFL